VQARDPAIPLLSSTRRHTDRYNKRRARDKWETMCHRADPLRNHWGREPERYICVNRTPDHFLNKA
jgi:hypothetical protein